MNENQAKVDELSAKIQALFVQYGIKDYICFYSTDLDKGEGSFRMDAEGISKHLEFLVFKAMKEYPEIIPAFIFGMQAYIKTYER
jgi:hypothetical protein